MQTYYFTSNIGLAADCSLIFSAIGSAESAGI